MGEPPPAKEDDQKPHEDVGTRQGFRRYKWEFKDSNREFWKNGHAVVKIMTLEIFNDLFTFGFLVGGIVFAWKARRRFPKAYFAAMVCMVAALQLFETVATHPILILLLTMEVSIFAFFIFLYTFAIDRYMPFISWPITVSKDCRNGRASHIQAPGKRQSHLR
ncbi:hypothetical protein NN561_007052 [Cricetulus griseus]